MKAEVLRTIKLGDGTVLGKGTIISEPFPADIKKELASPSIPPLARLLPEPPKPTEVAKAIEVEKPAEVTKAPIKKRLQKKVVTD